MTDDNLPSTAINFTLKSSQKGFTFAGYRNDPSACASPLRAPLSNVLLLSIFLFRPPPPFYLARHPSVRHTFDSLFRHSISGRPFASLYGFIQSASYDCIAEAAEKALTQCENFTRSTFHNYKNEGNVSGVAIQVIFLLASLSLIRERDSTAFRRRIGK